MMNGIFAFLILIGIFFAALNGRMPQVSEAVLQESGRAITLVISLMGSFCMWGGIMKIAQESGFTSVLARAISPITKRLFKGLNPRGEAMSAIAMNFAANILGLGNAATPLGISAMKAMQKEENAHKTATDNMAMFVVMNTASLQLIPTTTAMLRAAAGAENPLDILPAVWVASAVSVVSGVAAAKLLAKKRQKP